MTDVLVSAHSSLVDLGSTVVSVCTEKFLLLRSCLNDVSKFLLLSLEVLSSYIDLLLYYLELVLLVEDALLSLTDVLLSNLSEEALVLDLLVE